MSEATESPLPAEPGISSGSCPFHDPKRLPHPTRGDANNVWWPNRLNLKILAKHPAESNPLDPDFNYAAAFEQLDLAQVKADIATALHTSQDWWPADFGHYGPLIIRMAWHSAGTYRLSDGRGGANSGQQRFAPLNSWPDNVNLDKARRVLWPVKQRYGQSLSWADLLVLAGNVALEDMGFEPLGFAGGREDVWEPDEDVYWGPETEWLGGDVRYTGDRDLEEPLAATQMGLIYVNPQGPDGNPDPYAAAKDIRDTFGRMAMNDEETVALIAGGHTFGKTHGAGPADHVADAPETAGLEMQGLGWKSSFGSGHGGDTISSGLEVTWTTRPAEWSHDFFTHLFEYDWELTKSPAGAHQWKPKDGAGAGTVPHAHDPEKRISPTMLTTDITLKVDPIYGPISRRFYENPEEFRAAFANAWYKLTHRDMGPLELYRGPEVPEETFLWQDPLPAAPANPITDADVDALKAILRASELTVAQLVKTAWASASTFRGSDKRGGGNGGRIALSPQKDWAVNNPAELTPVIEQLRSIQAAWNAGNERVVSLADLIILGGAVGIEEAARAAGHTVAVPFTPGRVDTTTDLVDYDTVEALRPQADGFRNFRDDRSIAPAEFQLVDRANLLTLTAPEMTVLIGGLRVLGANYDGSDFGVFTKRPGQLTNDFFRTLLDNDLSWMPDDPSEQTFTGTTPAGDTWRGTRVDLIFGSNSELRALAEVYASDDASTKFINDFVKAWVKVSELDRFDLTR